MRTVMGSKLLRDTWLRASDKIISGLPGVYKLVDDLLVGGKDYVELASRVSALLERCRGAGITLSSNKVQCGSRVTFAGYVVEGTTVFADPRKVKVITKFPEPTNMKELRGWFGLTNQLQHYVPNLAGKQSMLRGLMTKGTIFWVDEAMQEEFEQSKRDILLNIFCIKRATFVVTDASGDGFAYILLQHHNAGFLVIQVGSAAIKKAWRNYSALELEATCIIWSLESLKFYLKGLASLELWSDHAPLRDAMKKPLRDLTPRLQKFREAVEGYGMTIKHVKGAQIRG